VLTLYTTPVIYIFFDRLANRGKEQGKPQGAGPKEPRGPDAAPAVAAT
jgi:hypothetical protein